MRHNVLFDPSVAQAQFCTDYYTRFLYMSGGYGSGKTYALVMKMLILMDKNPGIPGGCLCPTTKSFKRDVLPTIRQICGESGIEFYWKSQAGELYFPATQSTVFVYHAEDNGASIAGANLGWFVINEASLCSWEAVKAAFARVRVKRVPFPQIAMSGTPAEFNWVYQYFVEDAKPDRRIIFGSSKANKHTASWYVQMLEDSYDDIARQQYVDGLFIPRTGNRFLHKFNRHMHVTELATRVTGADVLVKVDFNVNPMVATLSSWIPRSKVPIRMFEEIRLSGADTYQLCGTLADVLGGGWERSIVFPDPAGNARKTSAKDLITDIKIMKDFGFTDLRFKNRPVLKEGYFSSNNLFDKNMVAIHPKCKGFIADAEQVKLKQGLFEMDKADPERTHGLDGFKNMAEMMFPVVKSYSEVVNRVIR